MMEKVSIMAVKSELSDWTRSIPVRLRACGSYRFSGPRGMGASSGSNEPNGEYRRPDDSRSG